MYTTVAAVVCALVGLSSAHMMGNMGNSGYGQQNQQNLMNMLQQQMGMGGQMNQWGQGGNMGSQWGQGANYGNMGHNQMNQQRPMGGNQGNNNQGVMGLLTMLLMQNMMQGNRQNMGGNQGNMGGNQGNMGGNQGNMGEDMEGMGEMEQYMRWKMMTEMADMMMVYMDFKNKEGEFGEAMEALCFLVNATFVAAQRINEPVFNQTTDESFMAMGKSLEGKSEAELMDFSVNMFITNRMMYSEVFFRVAMETCKKGESYMKAAVKMEKMSNEEECSQKKDDKK